MLTRSAPGALRPGRADESGGGWSSGGRDLPRADDHPSDHPFRTSAAARYQPLEVAGRGGMGEVVVARDLRLGREVALKRILAGRDGDLLSRRLAREAWITARLEHPSIVPVYDAGEGEDGRLYYTMRLIYGRSLAEALAEAKGQAERLPLLRHFLAVCEAMAYAHSHGIVHRDLKPQNIMVGAFGETQVVDWGLAGFVSEATARAFAAELPLSADLSVASARGAPPSMAISLPSARGTPVYMSPEQARGEGAGPRSDVWALGAILHEILVGQRLITAGDPQAALAQLCAGALDRGRLRDSGAPAELCAIVDKATAQDPAARYRDAGDVAADMARYLDGRRVEAHDYTTLELARRLLRQLRVPLIAAASALLTAAIALGLSFHRISAERLRALEAERSAQAALADTRKVTAWALARQSVADLAGGAIGEADLLAAHALLRGESVDARGVAAATRASPHPARAETIAIPGCDRVLPGSWDLALCQDDASVALWEIAPTAPPRRRWRRPLKARSALLISAGAPGLAPLVVVATRAAELLVLDGERGELVQRHPVPITTGFMDRVIDVGDGDHVAATEGRVVTVVSLREERVVYTDRPCAPTPVAALAPAPPRVAVVCDDGRALIWDSQRGTMSAASPALQVGARPISAALARDGGALVIGTVTGELVAVDLRSGRAAAPQRVLAGPVRRLALLGEPGRLVVSGESGGTLLWDLTAGAEVLRLPAMLSAGLRLDPRGLLTGGRRAGRWVVGGAMPPRALRVPVGIADIAISPDGRLVAAARSDGRVAVIERATGRRVQELLLGTAVVKAVDFSPDGQRLTAALSDPRSALHSFAVGSWAPLPLEGMLGGARRLRYNGQGELVALPYQPPLSLWSPAGRRREIPSPEMYDASATVDRRQLALLSVDGRVWRLQDGRLRAEGQDPGATMVALWPRGERVATGHDAGVSIHDPGGPPRWVPNPEARLTDLGVSPDGQHLVGARSDGTLAVWRSGDAQLVAVLRGHSQRVASLAFAPDGLLVSAGWDGQILTWDLGALATPAAALVQRAERVWAADLPLVLHR